MPSTAVRCWREFRRGVRRIRRGWRKRTWQRFHGERAFVDKSIDNAGADAGLLGRLRLAVQKTIGQQFDQSAPRWRHALRRRPHQAHARPHPLRSEILAHAQAHPHHHAARR
jgi:hypothetical protein